MEKDTLVDLWEQLLEEGCVEAATGLLFDLFRFLHFVEAQWPPSVSPEHAETESEIREPRRAQVREVLMQLLDDEDGGALKSWYKLYCDDPAALQERVRQIARDKNYAHESGLWLDGIS